MTKLGRGGGIVVSMLPFSSDSPSSNPAEIYNFSVNLLLKELKLSKRGQVRLIFNDVTKLLPEHLRRGSTSPYR